MSAASVSEEYRNLLSAQRMLIADIENPDTPAKDRASCARVLAAVIDQKRVLRMKPKPKDIDVSKMQRRARPAAATAQPSFTTPSQADAA